MRETNLHDKKILRKNNIIASTNAALLAANTILIEYGTFR